MQRQLVCFALLALALLNVVRSSPSINSDTGTLPRGHVTSLFQKLRLSSGGSLLPTIGRSQQARAQRRAMTLGSRLEPAAGGLPLSPGVKAMRYGRRSATNFSL